MKTLIQIIFFVSIVGAILGMCIDSITPKTEILCAMNAVLCSVMLNGNKFDN